MIEEIAALVFFLIENCTGVLIADRGQTGGQQQHDEQTSLIQQNNEEGLQDLTINFGDPDDEIFREYDPPAEEEEDPKAWKKNRPKLRTSIWKSIKYVFYIQTLSGTALGLLAIFVAFLDFHSADLCYGETANWNRMPHIVGAVRVTGQAVEGFIIQLWDYFLLSTVFPWRLLKGLNILTINLSAAFIDVVYRLFFQLYGIYKIWWMSYPLNVLFITVIIINSVVLARHFNPRPNGWKRVMKLAFILCVQFILGMSVIVYLVYKIFPWYNEQEEITKVVVAAFCPLLTAFPKVVSRLAAQHLKEIHPGKAHVFVGVLYGSTAIIFRIMQVELKSFNLFVALGIGHAFVDLLERLTITMRDEIWEAFYRLIKCQRIRPQSKYRSPRSRRFMADVSIQIMLQETTALVAALGFIQLYHFMYSDTKRAYTDYQTLGDFFVRASTGLVIDLVFNTISVVIQSHYMNFPVMRVWRKKWRYHLVVNTIISTLTMVYFTEYLFGVIRGKYNYHTHRAVRFNWNCTLPFT